VVQREPVAQPLLVARFLVSTKEEERSQEWLRYKNPVAQPLLVARFLVSTKEEERSQERLRYKTQ
jgi:hypothetical protein